MWCECHATASPTPSSASNFVLRDARPRCVARGLESASETPRSIFSRAQKRNQGPPKGAWPRRKRGPKPRCSGAGLGRRGPSIGDNAACAELAELSSEMTGGVACRIALSAVSVSIIPRQTDRLPAWIASEGPLHESRRRGSAHLALCAERCRWIFMSEPAG